ncbi:MAG TPA: superoxide dismutase family protein [Thermoanaerobaculia bacterium]|nr:superoxide dismutase family protein [Thermoanaerobaculia bacterium]
MVLAAGSLLVLGASVAALAGPENAVEAARGKAPAGQAATAKTAAAKTAAPQATAKLESADDPKLSGSVTFTQLADAVRVVVVVAGVDKPGPHGIHLHENGKCEHDPAGKHYTSAGGHFNPTAAEHACRESTTHHAGDFGNIEIKPDGTGHLEVVTSMLSLKGPNSPVGKAVVLHTGEDDCKTQPTGNSGGRLACGVVEAAGGAAH